MNLWILPSGLEVIKPEFILKLKIKRNDRMHADACPQAANHCAVFWVFSEDSSETAD